MRDKDHRKFVSSQPCLVCGRSPADAHARIIGLGRGVSPLAQAGVIKPWPITIKSEQGDRTVSGLYCFDEAALNALSNEDFLKLRASPALPIAYAQLLSMGQLGVFENLARIQAQLAPRPVAPLPDSLDKLFDRTDNLEIHFD
jgi:hypothetical protein